MLLVNNFTKNCTRNCHDLVILYKKMMRYKLPSTFLQVSPLFKGNKCCHRYGYASKSIPTTSTEGKEKATELKTSKRKYDVTIIKNANAADMMVNQLKQYINKDDTLMEVDPGNCILTESLLKSFNNRVVVFNASSTIDVNLERKCNEKYKNIIFSKINIHDMWRLYWKYEMNFPCQPDYSALMDLLHLCHRKSSHLYLVGAVSSVTLLYGIMNCFSRRAMLYEPPLNPTLLFFVPSYIHYKLMKKSANKVYWRLGILANLCYEVNVIDSISASSFKNNFSLKRKSKNIPDLNKFFLIKFTPRTSLGSNGEMKIFDKELKFFLEFLNYFLRHSSKTSLMMHLEKFIPSVGKELIKKGFKVYTNQYDLTDDEWLTVYRIFSSHPNYHDSTYVKVMLKHRAECVLDSNFDDSEPAEEIEINESV